jgi:MFS family permease
LLIPYFNVFFARRFDVADDMLGLIFAALNITIGLSALAGPLISIRIGKMPTIVLAQALSLPFLLAIGFAPLLWVSVGAALARAALFNMISPLYDAFAMEQTEEALRPTVIGAINGSFASAYIVMPLVSTRVQEDYGFAPLFVATAACYLLATLANYVLFVRGHAAAA